MKSTFFTLFSVLSYVSSEQFSENVHLEKDLKVEGNTELQGSVSLEGPVHITGKVNFGDSSVDAMTLLNNIQERLNGIENMFVHNDDGSLDLIPDVNFRGNVKFLGDSESVSQKDTQEPTQEATQEPTQEATQGSQLKKLPRSQLKKLPRNFRFPGVLLDVKLAKLMRVSKLA